MRYKDRDVVLISKDLKENVFYNNKEFVIPEMLEYAGKGAIIECITNGTYKLEDIPYFWTDDMIEKLVYREGLFDIENGMFGETTEGFIFVVVGDNLVYKDGFVDNLDIMLERFPEKISKVVKGCESFNQYKDGVGEVIYSKKKQLTIEELEELLGFPVEVVE